MGNEKDIKDLIHSFDKKHGKGVVSIGDSISVTPSICGTGSLKLDSIMGGGIKNKIYEYVGEPSSGKSTLSLHTIAEAQRCGLTCALLDFENAFDITYAQNIGVNLDNLIVATPDYGEQGFDIMEELVKSNVVSIIVCDSVGAMQPKSIIEAEYEDQNIGAHARMMSKGLPKINSVMKDKNCAIIFINQQRVKIGGFSPVPGQVQKTTQGGEALKYYASVRAKVSRGEVIGVRDNPFGFKTKISLMKSKVSRPFRQIETSIYIGLVENDVEKWGIDKDEEICDIVVDEEIEGVTIEKAGAWYRITIPELKIEEERFQGKPNLVNYIKTNEAVFNYVKQKVNEKFANTPPEQNPNSFSAKMNEEEQKTKKRVKKEEPVLEETNIVKEVAIVEEEDTKE